MEYVVIRSFTDKDTQDKYTVGDRYPRRGFAKKERVEELSTVNNRRGVPLIEAKSVKETVKETVPTEDVESVVEDKSERKQRKKK